MTQLKDAPWIITGNDYIVDASSLPELRKGINHVVCPKCMQRLNVYHARSTNINADGVYVNGYEHPCGAKIFITNEIAVVNAWAKEALTEELNNLEQLGRTACPASGHYTVVAIVKYLRGGNIIAAQGVYQSDGDKLHSYPEIQKCVKNLLGCHLHLVKNCHNPFCKENLSEEKVVDRG